MFEIIKVYDHSLGLTSAFRQWRAPETHCSRLHSYSFRFEICFKGEKLDERNWLISFGELKDIKNWLIESFDHKTLVAEDDPELDWFLEAQKRNIADLNILPNVGCESFAKMVFEFIENWLLEKGFKSVVIDYVKISEHDANHAIYRK